MATVALAGLFAVGAALIGLELGRGALDAGALETRDPCGRRAPYPGQGLDPMLQRVVLDGLDGAACELGTTREELVLSLAPSSATAAIPWDDETIERALRAGLLEAIDDAERRGSMNAVVALLLRQLVERAPVRWLIDGSQGLAGLLG